MFFRGARIQRDGQGRCNVLSSRIVSNVRAELPSLAALTSFIHRVHTPIVRTSSEFASRPERTTEIEEPMPLLWAQRRSLLSGKLTGQLIATRLRITWSDDELPFSMASGSPTVRKPRRRSNVTRNQIGRSGVAQKDSRCTAASA